MCEEQALAVAARRDCPGLKSAVKQKLEAYPRSWAAYWYTKQQVRRLLLLRWYFYDIANTYRFMFWRPGNTSYRRLSSELVFQFHKIEKGLVMPGKFRLFGVDPAIACMKLLVRWISHGFSRHDPVFLGAIESLVAYEERLAANNLDPKDQVLSKLSRFLEANEERDRLLQTPQKLNELAADGGTVNSRSFGSLALMRRSVRNFEARPVSVESIETAVRSAQLSPSACNRQPWHLYVVSDAAMKNRLLGHQNGNRGFGHLAPHIAILTSDECCFFDASERHEPYIDGGLFAMSFILALSADGIGSCCLNWCVSPGADRAAHRLINIPESRRITMLIAFGYPAAGCVVPRSPRRAIGDVLTFA